MSEKIKLFIDGASKGNPGKSAIGIKILLENNHCIKELKERIPDATNNQAEYIALIRALIEVINLSPEFLEIYSDSELLIKQLEGHYKIKNPTLKFLNLIACWLIKSFRGKIIFRHIPREKNFDADFLANKALSNKE